MKMKWLFPVAGAAVMVFGASLASVPARAQVQAEAQAQAELQTVSFVDVNRYLGKWYEIARLPQPFEAGCTAVSAEYSLNEDGSVKVFNSCRLQDPKNGALQTIIGRAVAVDSSNAKLDVSFFEGKALGKYWILELDPDYNWALVGEPSRSSLFILSRSATLDDQTYQTLLHAAVDKHGYDISKLIKTEQNVD